MTATPRPVIAWKAPPDAAIRAFDFDDTPLFPVIARRAPPDAAIPTHNPAMTPIYGIDFTSSPRKAKPITVARGRLAKNVFELEGIESLPDWAQFEAFLIRPGPWVGGFDFPFGLPREAVIDLGWPLQWKKLTAHCASLGRERFRNALDAWRAPRPVGNKYAHRATDIPARSHSPLKLVNPPVGLMFLEGASRLAAAGLGVPGIVTGDESRIALEAYPGLAARAITRESYKSDEKAKQTPARRKVRAEMVSVLARDGGPFGFTLSGDCKLLASLTRDASGDRLDAVLAAMLAAWGWKRRSRNYGLPGDVDPLEGWIVMA